MKKNPELQWSPSPSGLEQLYGRDTILKSAAEQAVGFGFHLQVNSQERCPAAVTTSAGGVWWEFLSHSRLLQGQAPVTGCCSREGATQLFILHHKCCFNNARGGRESSGSEVYDWVMVIVVQQQHSFPERTCFPTVIMRGASRWRPSKCPGFVPLTSRNTYLFAY